MTAGRHEASDADYSVAALSRELGSVASAIETMLEELRGVQLSVNTLKTRAEASTEELKLLSKILRDGDGSGNSVMTRLALAERLLEEVRGDLDKKDDAEDRHADTRVLARWTVWAGIISGVIGFVASVLAVVIAIKGGGHP
jgi:chromosome segregation ATPase